MIKPDNPRQGQTIKLISNEKTPYNKVYMQYPIKVYTKF